MSTTEQISIWIGSKIKNNRKEQQLNLNDLSEKSGVSTAMLSKIENGRVVPTLPSLLLIFDALEIDLNSFFNDFYKEETFPGYIFKKRNDYQYTEKEEDSTGFRYETILSHTLNKSSMEISLLTLGQGAQRKKLSTEGYEYIYVIKGSVAYELDNHTFEMEEGDSLFFDGRMEHVPHNPRGSDAILLVVYFITIT